MGGRGGLLGGGAEAGREAHGPGRLRALGLRSGGRAGRCGAAVVGRGLIGRLAVEAGGDVGLPEAGHGRLRSGSFRLFGGSGRSGRGRLCVAFVLGGAFGHGGAQTLDDALLGDAGAQRHVQLLGQLAQFDHRHCGKVLFGHGIASLNKRKSVFSGGPR